MQSLFCFVLVLVAMTMALPDQYTDRYDSVNIDQILASERLLNNYFNCLVEKGPCTPEGTELRSVLPDALENGCSKCTEQQKQKSEKVLRFLIENKAKQWNELQAKYDPRGVYRQRYQSLAAEKGVTV